VTLLGYDPDGEKGVETVVLADASWTAAQVRAMALAAAATAGDDSITGFDGADQPGGEGRRQTAAMAALASRSSRRSRSKMRRLAAWSSRIGPALGDTVLAMRDMAGMALARLG
jgi:hypothetical protein